jgi:hypothetical protein
MPQPYTNGELVIVIDCADLDRSARFWTVRHGSGLPCSATRSVPPPAARISASRRSYCVHLSSKNEGQMHAIMYVHSILISIRLDGSGRR